MSNINVHLDDNYMHKFKELKVFLECNTNEETIERLILLAQTHIQQKMLNREETENKKTRSSVKENLNRGIEKK